MPINSKKSEKGKDLKVKAENFFALLRSKFRSNKSRIHKSFIVSKRRDYVRNIKIAGLFSIIATSAKIIRKNIKIFLLLAVIYIVISAIFVGVASQDAFNNMSSILNKSGSNIFTGSLGSIGKAALIMISSVSGSTTSTLTQAQQMIVFILALMVWLTTVWLVRNYQANKKVSLRDGLYNSGSPIIATAIVVFVAMIQLIPILVAAIAYNAANTTGLISGGGAPAMLFWFAEALIVVLTLYFLTGTLLALVIVTIPGMYPFKALHIANAIVSGIRTRILSRIIGLIVVDALAWSLIEIITIILTTLLNNAVKGSSSIPIVPISMLILSVAILIWSAVYLYVLYREVVKSDVKSKND